MELEWMVCIDQLIDSFHISLRTGKKTRSFTNVLIESSHDPAEEFHDRISAKTEGADKDLWRTESKSMYSWHRDRHEKPRFLIQSSPNLCAGGNILQLSI